MKMTAKIEATGSLTLDLEGEQSAENHPSVAAARQSVLRVAKSVARQTGTVTDLAIEDPSGSWVVTIDSEGRISEQPALNESEKLDPSPRQSATPVTVPAQALPSPPPPTPTRTPAEDPAPAAVPTPENQAQLDPAASRPVTEVSVAELEAAFEAPADSSQTRASLRNQESARALWLADTKVSPAQGGLSFVEEPGRQTLPSFVGRPDAAMPAQHGVRGWLNQFGLHLGPSVDERSQREDESSVAHHWPGPRTVAVVNPKGGAGKTPTVICLSAVFARLGGSGVLAWDNNNSLGSLGWRTFDAGHEATVVDLLEQTEHFMTAAARSGDLSSYVHHQPADQYDVLRSDDRSGDQERHLVTGQEVDRLYAVAAKYYRLILMDSGNTERGDNWQSMIGHADQIVIPVKSVNDAAEGASRVLSALRSGNRHAQNLADQAVVIVLASDPSHEKAKLNQLAESFRPFVRAVATIPYDRALVEGRIRFSSMAPRTRRAWLRAAAEIAGEL